MNKNKFFINTFRPFRLYLNQNLNCIAQILNHKLSDFITTLKNIKCIQGNTILDWK
jgi:hypothetical protein